MVTLKHNQMLLLPFELPKNLIQILIGNQLIFLASHKDQQCIFFNLGHSLHHVELIHIEIGPFLEIFPHLVKNAGEEAGDEGTEEAGKDVF